MLQDYLDLEVNFAPTCAHVGGEGSHYPKMLTIVWGGGTQLR